MIGRLDRVVNYAVLTAFSIVALFPIVGLVLSALHPPSSLGGGFSLSGGIHFASFQRAWTEGHFATYLRSSVIVSLSVVAAATLLSIMAGYAFGTMRFRGHKALFYLLLVGIMVPMEALIVPLYYDMRAAELTDTYWALILPQVGLSVAFGTFWMRAYFLTAPRSLMEAAELDGARPWAILWRVLLPLGRPAVLTMTVLIFMWTWNEFLLALVMVSSESLRTAPLGLAFFQGQHVSNFALLAAGATIVSLPVVVLYIFLQRHFIRGMMSGAVKG
ncbi:carbohydrate ABC transporter permease [soil metagenome]